SLNAWPTSLGLICVDTNHSPSWACVHLLPFNKLETTDFAIRNLQYPSSKSGSTTNDLAQDLSYKNRLCLTPLNLFPNPYYKRLKSLLGAKILRDELRKLLDVCSLRSDDGVDCESARVGELVAVRLGDFADQVMGPEQPQESSGPGGPPFGLFQIQGRLAIEQSCHVTVAEAIDGELPPCDCAQQRCIPLAERLQGANSSSLELGWGADFSDDLLQRSADFSRGQGFQVPLIGLFADLGASMQIGNALS
ncbi:MAG: hypothetical protein JWP89_2875, partial [Schlesneria sp.]|nr:hypothetical protein [Schlesneria sp.]